MVGVGVVLIWGFALIKSLCPCLHAVLPRLVGLNRRQLSNDRLISCFLSGVHWNPMNPISPVLVPCGLPSICKGCLSGLLALCTPNSLGLFLNVPLCSTRCKDVHGRDGQQQLLWNLQVIVILTIQQLIRGRPWQRWQCIYQRVLF